jgi:hypothetical protein
MYLHLGETISRYIIHDLIYLIQAALDLLCWLALFSIQLGTYYEKTTLHVRFGYGVFTTT